jgi:hypothetical protein
MRLSHARAAISVRFDDPNLVSCAGLVPVMALAARCGLTALLVEGLTLAGKGSANAAAKITALIAGMIAGADSISDMDLLRHGGMGRVFDGVRAPSTLGTFLRGSPSVTFANSTPWPPGCWPVWPPRPRCCPGPIRSCSSTSTTPCARPYGYAKQGAGRGYTGVKGLNALLAVASTPTSAPVIAATRLRKGSTNSARGAGKLLADALATARRAGAGLARNAMVLVRADSAYYGFDIINVCRRAAARFSVTARLTPSVVKAITSIDEQAWTAIRYPNAIFDEDEQRWVSDAEVAEVSFTAFTGRRRAEHVTARLIVRRVRRLNPKAVPPGQTEAFAVYRYHAVFTDNPEPMLAAEATRHHRAGRRRAEERPTRAPTLGPVRRERRLAGLRRDLPQPHPRRRCPGRRPPHPRPDRDPARPTDQHPGPGRALRAPPDPAPPT